MHKNREQDSTLKLRLAVGISAAIALVAAPVIVLGGAIGGYLGSKASTKIAHKKYGPRDIGGVFPGAMVVIAGTASSALVGGYAGHALIDGLCMKTVARLALRANYGIVVV